MPERVGAKFAYKTATRSINVTEVNKERRVLFHLMVISKWDHKLPCESFTSIARRMCRCDTSKPVFLPSDMLIWSFVHRHVDLQVHLFFTASIDWSVKAQPESICYCFSVFLLRWALYVLGVLRKTISRAHAAFGLSDFPVEKSLWVRFEEKVDIKFLELSFKFFRGPKSINLLKVLGNKTRLVLTKRFKKIRRWCWDD